jgi:valyl-tRNA synthetase
LIAPKGHDILFETSQIELGRNFMNKLWNASRFVLMNYDDSIAPGDLPDETEMETPDKWILAELKKTIGSVDGHLKEYRFNDAAKDIYDFTWNYFCDWYIELIKPRLYGDDQNKKATALKTAIYVLRNIVKLLHPYAPFITEEIWQSVKTDDEKDIMISEWPKADELSSSKKAVKNMTLVMDVITAIRTIRSEMTVPPSKKADVLIGGGNEKTRQILSIQHNYIETLAKVGELTIADTVEQPELSSSAVVGDLEIYVSLAGLIDIDKEKERLEKDIAAHEGRIKAGLAKLNNPNFVSRAPEKVVEHERNKLAGYRETLALLIDNYKKLVG